MEAGDRLGEGKEAITLEWPLNIQSVLQTRGKLHLRTAPGVKASEPLRAPKQLFSRPGTGTHRAILLLDFVENLRMRI